jgi:hypothetical protein
MRRRELANGFIACICLAGVLLGPTWLRFPLAILLVAVLPGNAVADAVLPSSSGVDRALIALSLSFVSVVFGGLLLDATVGITRLSFAVLLVAVTLVAGAFTVRFRRPQADRQASARVVVRVRDVLMFVAAGVVVVGAVVFARSPLHASGARGYTVLSMAPQGQRLRLTVESQELRRSRYRLVVRQGPKQIRQWQLALAPGRSWGAAVAARQGRRAVEATLYVRRGRSWIVYREVRTAGT